ncbi:MAG: erythromycin esterase family protein [Flavisolibacter sp.]
MDRQYIKELMPDEQRAVSIIKDNAYILSDQSDLQPLFDQIGNAQIVLLGEASHGTHEYYTWRSYITQRLIKEKDFKFIAVEGDWPDCYLLNRYIKNYPGSGKSAVEVLKQFNRWPTWMWANWEIAALTEWLFQYNKALPVNNKIGFYGLDVYSLWESMDSIMQYLRKVDPNTLIIAEEAFRCFEPYQHDEGISYAKATQFVPDLCKDEVVDLLRKIQQRLPQYNTDHENVFNLKQNAYVIVNAEKYYSAMIHGGPHSWNVRDSHMSDTLDRLLQFHGPATKVIIWEHNTHIGDARATNMTTDGMFNLGELVRLKHHDKGVVLVGFGSYKGEVIAGRKWGSTMKTIEMPPARKGSWEDLLHKAGTENKLLLMKDLFNEQFMENHIGHRAIGVVYNPATDQYGNYVPSLLPLRYDAFIYLDHTHALHPLHIQPDGHQIPETYPFGV